MVSVELKVGKISNLIFMEIILYVRLKNKLSENFFYAWNCQNFWYTITIGKAMREKALPINREFRGWERDKAKGDTFLSAGANLAVVPDG